MKVNVIVVHVGKLDFTLTRSLIRIPTRSPHCAVENNTTHPTELSLVFAVCEHITFRLCFGLVASLGFCRNVFGAKVNISYE